MRLGQIGLEDVALVAAVVRAADEAEAAARFEQEGSQARDEEVSEFALPHGAAQAEEAEG